MKRVFLIVLDSVGVGEMPDAAAFGDEGSNTIGAASSDRHFLMPNMRRLGLFNIAGVKMASPKTINVYDILKYSTVVASKAAVSTIEEVYA